MDQEAEAQAMFAMLRRAGITITAERAAALAEQLARLEQVWSVPLPAQGEPWTMPAAQPVLGQEGKR